MAPEILFNPALIGLPAETLSLPETIHKVISQSETLNPSDLFGNIFICGGGSLMAGLAERIEAEVGKLAPKGRKVKVHALPPRQFAAFSGASDSASQDSFDTQWVLKAGTIFFLLISNKIILIISFRIRGARAGFVFPQEPQTLRLTLL